MSIYCMANNVGGNFFAGLMKFLHLAEFTVAVGQALMP